MKLLPKKAVNTQVQSAHKAMIDEGVLIAKKVDTLRQTLTSLESQHNQFIAGMKGELEQKLGGLQKLLSLKEIEVKELEEKRLKLIEPLDSAWHEVRQKEEEVRIKIEDSNQKNHQLSVRLQQVEEKLKLEKETLNKINIRDRESARAYTIAEELRIASEKTNTEILNKRLVQDTYFENKHTEIAEKEKVIKSEWFMIDREKDKLDIAKKDIINQNIFLKDQRRLLEKGFEELRSKNAR